MIVHGLNLCGFLCLCVFKSALQMVICALMLYYGKINLYFYIKSKREGHFHCCLTIGRSKLKAFPALSWVSWEIWHSFPLILIIFKSKGFYHTCQTFKVSVQTWLLVSSLRSCLVFSISVSSVTSSVHAFLEQKEQEKVQKIALFVCSSPLIRDGSYLQIFIIHFVCVLVQSFY